MQRKFLFNLSLLVFLNLLVKPFYILGIDTEILDRVGQAEYGLYFALMNLSFILNIFLDMGTVNFNTSTIAKHEHLVSKHFGSMISVRLMLSAFYILVCLSVFFILGYPLHHLELLLPICLNQILSGFILYLRSNLSGLQLFIKDSLISVLDRLILIFACAAVLWGHVFGTEISIELFIYLQTFAYSLTCLTALAVLSPHLSQLRIRYNRLFNMVILKKSFPYALLILLMNVYFRTDAIMLERMLDNGAYEAGIYAQAFRFFEAGNMLAYLFGVLLFPMFSKLVNDKEKTQDLLNLSFRIMMVFSVTAGLAGFYYSEEIMNLRFSSEIETSSKAFRFLMIAFTGICGTYIFGSLLTAREELKALNYVALSAVFFNIILNFLLIPDLGAEGAALASMVTQLLMTLSQILLVKKYIHLSPGRSVLVRLFVFIVLSVLLIYPVNMMGISWIPGIVIFCAMAILASLITGLISLRSVVAYVGLLKRNI